MVEREQNTMFNRIKHIIISFLLTSYLFVGAVAHLESMGRLFQYDSKPEKVEQAKRALPSPERVCWTQYKHIPSFTKIAQFSPALVAPLESPSTATYTPLLVPSDVRVTQPQFYTSVSSRAPPPSSAVS
jgi:hypothetical protein